MREKSRNVSRLSGGMGFGLVLVGVGILFLLDNFGVADFGSMVRWWPLLPLGWGALLLTGAAGRSRPLAGALIMLGSAWLLLHNLGVIPYDLWDLWPVALIALGVSVVWKAVRGPRNDGPGFEKTFTFGVGVERESAVSDAVAATESLGDEEEGTVDASPKLNAVAVWSGTRTQVVSRQFRGGDATAVMGGHDIDLRHAKLEGGQAVLEVLVVMGGIDIFVPEDWKVSNEAFAMMGAIEDNTRAPVGPARGLLILRGFVLMGGVEVKN